MQVPAEIEVQVVPLRLYSKDIGVAPKFASLADQVAECTVDPRKSSAPLGEVTATVGDRVSIIKFALTEDAGLLAHEIVSGGKPQHGVQQRLQEQPGADQR